MPVADIIWRPQPGAAAVASPRPVMVSLGRPDTWSVHTRTAVLTTGATLEELERHSIGALGAGMRRHPGGSSIRLCQPGTRAGDCVGRTANHAFCQPTAWWHGEPQ